jgi:hypothetical protein
MFPSRQYWDPGFQSHAGHRRMSICLCTGFVLSIAERVLMTTDRALFQKDHTTNL